MQLRFPGYGSVLPVALGRQEYLGDAPWSFNRTLLLVRPNVC